MSGLSTADPPRLCNGLKQTKGSSDIEALNLKVSISGSAAEHLHPSEEYLLNLLKRNGCNIIWDKHLDPPSDLKTNKKQTAVLSGLTW